MRKIKRIFNIALIFMLIGMLACQKIYAISDTLRLPLGNTIDQIEQLTEIHDLIEKALPSELDVTSKVDFVVSRFGQDWDVALSMMGYQLLDPWRWAFIDRALKAELPITTIADLLHYEFNDLGLEIRIEMYPDWFQDVVLRKINPRNGLDRNDIDELWAIYYLRWHKYREINPDLAELAQYTMAFDSTLERIFKEVVGFEEVLDHKSEKRVIKEILSKLRGKQISYKWGGTHMPGLDPKGDNVKLGSDQSIFKFYALEQAKESIFSVYINDKDLCKELEQYINYYSATKPLFLGSIEFDLTDNKKTAAITQLQIWLQIDRLPPSIKNRLGATGDIEMMLEQCFNAYLLQRGITEIKTLTGSYLFKNTALPMHRNSIERLNALYKNAGYNLIYQDGQWWWRFKPTKSKAILRATRLGVRDTIDSLAPATDS